MKKLFFLFFSWFALTGATYYVDPTGLDSNTGGIGDPFLTIQKGVDTAINAGDVVSINDGTYTAGFVKSSNSGAVGNPIIIKATNRGGVTIDASTAISGWTSAGTNLYNSGATGLASSAARARLWKVGQTTMLTQKTTSSSVSEEGDFFYNSSTDKFLIYTTSDPSLSVYKGYDRQSSDDAPPIWVYGVSYVTLDGISAQYGQILYKIGSLDTDSNTVPTTNIIVQYCTSQYSTGLGAIGAASSNTANSSYFTFDHNTIAYSDDIGSGTGANGHGIKFAANTDDAGGSYLTVTNNIIHDCRYHGVQVSNGWKNPTIQNNTIYNTSLKGSGQGADIRLGHLGNGVNDSGEISGNLLGGDGAGGLSLGSGIYLQEDPHNVNIFGNRIFDHTWHMFYLFQTSTGLYPYNINIYNNLGWNNNSSGLRNEGSHSVNFFNNNIYDVGESSQVGTAYCIDLVNSHAQGVVAKNNICSNLVSTGLGVRVASGASYTGDYNIFYNPSTSLTMKSGSSTYSLSDFSFYTNNDRNSLAVDPQWVNPASGTNFNLGASSPARGGGFNLNSIFTTDYVNTVRNYIWDMGAYENSSEILVQGVRIE